MMTDKYLLGSEKSFYDFVKEIPKNSTIASITHTDLDGIASGIFLQKILESRGLKINSMNFLNYGADVLKNFSKNNKYDFLFFTDWSADSYPEDLEQLRRKGKVFVIDHHPINESLKDKTGIIKTDSYYCSTRAMFDLGKKYLNMKSLEWLVCSAIILDYTWDKLDNFPFIKSIYPEVKEDSTIWESEPGLIGQKISGALTYYTPNIRKVYDLVLEGNLKNLEKASRIVDKETNKWVEKYQKESEYFPDKKLHFFYGTPKYPIASAIASIVSDTIFRDDTTVFVSDNSEKKGFVKASSRNQTGNIDMGKLLKKSTEGFEDSSAGGHIKASASTFPKKYLNEFRQNLLREL